MGDMIRDVLRTVIPITRRTPHHAHRRFSTIMDTSSFTETQLTVREAVSKICSKFPDVRTLPLLSMQRRRLTGSNCRTIGRSGTQVSSILTNFMQRWQRTVGLASACPQS